MKEIGCTFTMGGTYHLDERSVYAARLKAMGNLPLPESREYVPDSFVVDDITECMVANGWGEDEVHDLSRFTPETLTAEIDRRCKLGIEKDDEWEFTTTRLKEFLLDYYGVDYDETRQSEEKAPTKELGDNDTKKELFIVVCKTCPDKVDAIPFVSMDEAMEYVRKSSEAATKELIKQWYHPLVQSNPLSNQVRITDQDSNPYYSWDIVQSTLHSSSAPSPAAPAEEKTVTEMCPHCEQEVTMRWDTTTMGFRAFCPICGNPLMLCDECRQSGAACDYDSENDCCRLDPAEPVSMEIPPALRVETPLGAIIVRTDMDGDGVWVDLRRPDSVDDMNLVHVRFSPKDKEACIEAIVDGEGKKDGKSERVEFDGIEDYFRAE